MRRKLKKVICFVYITSNYCKIIGTCFLNVLRESPKDLVDVVRGHPGDFKGLVGENKVP